MSQNTFRDFILDQLAAVPEMRCKRMFGGFGLYAGEHFFGIIHRGRLYFRTSEESRAAFAAAGMAPFRPSERAVLKAYYEVPADVLENGFELVEWSRAAIAVSVTKNAA